MRSTAAVIIGIFLLLYYGNLSYSYFTTLFSIKRSCRLRLVATIKDSIWDDPSRLSSLTDPPSSERLAIIQENSYKGGFEPTDELSEPYHPNISFGSVPSDLVGSLAVNRPGRIRVGDTQYGHWFDGDGYVSMLSFDGKKNRVVFNGRYIQSKRFKDQQRLMNKLKEDGGLEALARPPLAFVGAWTKRWRGEWYENIGRFPTNPANTAIMWIKGKDDEEPKLYALCEGGHPIQLNPHTLEVIQDEKPLMSSDGSTKVNSFFSAHFHRCPINGEIINHGFFIRPGPLLKEMNVMKLKPDGSLIHQVKSPLPFDCLVHDSALSKNYIVFFLPPYYIPKDKILSLITGTSTLGNMIEWHDEENAYVQINSRDDLKLKWRIKLPEITSLYHFVDAFEEENNKDGSATIVLKVRIAEHEPMDRIALEQQFSDQYQVNGTRVNALLKEFTFRLEQDGEGYFVSKHNVADDAALCEFPTVNSAYRPTQRRRYCWTNALSAPSVQWLDGIQKVDMDVRTSSTVVTFGSGTFAGPPIFVPKEDMIAEDDGYIITTVYCSLEHRSDVVICDAATLESLCVIELRNHLSFQFHGDYIADYLSN